MVVGLTPLWLPVMLNLDYSQLVGKAGQKIVIHVNRHNLAYNTKHNTQLPIYTIKVGNKNLYAWEVLKTGPSRLENHIEDPLACGARAYDVTYDPVVLFDSSGIVPFGGLTFDEVQSLK